MGVLLYVVSTSRGDKFRLIILAAHLQNWACSFIKSIDHSRIFGHEASFGLDKSFKAWYWSYSRKLVDHHYFQTHEYEAPGIAVFMFDNATFVSCERSYYYNDTE